MTSNVDTCASGCNPATMLGTLVASTLKGAGVKVNKTTKTVCAGLAIAALSTAGLVTGVPQANAATCSAWRVLVEDRAFLPDFYRARGQCTQISSTERVQVRLDSIGNIDPASEWFTRTYTTYGTGRDVWTRGAYYTVRPR